MPKQKPKQLTHELKSAEWKTFEGPQTRGSQDRTGPGPGPKKNKMKQKNLKCLSKNQVLKQNNSKYTAENDSCETNN